MNAAIRQDMSNAVRRAYQHGWKACMDVAVRDAMTIAQRKVDRAYLIGTGSGIFIGYVFAWLVLR